ncbi:HNH endonuclease [Mycolicibacterium conceptionense]
MCSVAGCERSTKARGWCSTHYQRFLKHGDPNVLKASRGVRGVAACAVDNCPEKAFSKGLCNKHYLRSLKHGDPTKVLCAQDKRPAEDRWRGRYEVDIATGCWNWTGHLANGYGIISVRGIDCRAHRFVYEQLIGPIENGMTLDHLCHNRDLLCPGGDPCTHRRCVNPDHMDPVPHVVNVMRGKAPAATNSRKTHCKYGHEFTPENTIIRKGGHRGCRACGRRQQREYHERKRAIRQ